MIELPERMAKVTPAWLQQAVADHPAFTGTRITGMRAARIGEGIGQMSELARVELIYAGAPGPASVVVKLQTPFEGMLSIGERYEMYARETAFYQTLAPEVTVPLPAVYFGAWDPAARRNTLVIEDLAHWYWPDQLQGATAQQAQRCVDALAQLGAGHWGADFAAQPWLPDTQDAALRAAVADYELCVPLTTDRLQAYLSPAARDACMRILANMTWLLAELAQPPLVLTHYDCRLENFVFEDASASRLALLDWQLVAKLHPGWDIAYFLGTSLTEAQRRTLQPALLAQYLDGLRRYGVRDYDEGNLTRDFRLGTMAMTLIPIIGGAGFDMSNARSLELFGSMARRAFTSVLDNDCLTLLPA